VILNYSSWQRRFRARRDIIGRVLLLSGEPYTVIGVMPERFSFAPRGRGEFWVPYQAGEGCDQQRGCHSLNGVGRLRDGSTAAQARSELQSLAAELARQYPDTNRGRGVRVVSLADSFVADYRPVLLALFAAACLLLLIACVNVCGLLLVRAESRRREMAVRAALGASPLRLARQLVTESLVPTGLGCLLALALSLALVRLLTTLVPQHMRNGMPFLECLGLNRHVALFAAALTAGAAGLMAASLLLRLPLRRLGEALAAGGRGSSGTTWRRLGARMVVVELALATLLLAGSGLLGRSLIRLLHVKLGFEPRHLAAMEVDSAAARSGDGGDHTAEFDRDLLRRLEAVPGVRSAALSSVLPVSYNSNTDWLRFVGQPWHGEHNESLEREVTPGYFRTLGAGLLRGRAFTDQDDGVHPRVAIINHSLAQRYFPGKDPVGRQVGGLDLAPGSIKTIIGVVEDIHEGPLDEAVWPAIYYPMAQAPDSSVRVLVRTEGSPEAMLPALSAAVRGIGRGVGTLDPETMTSRIADSPSVYLRRSAAWVTGGFAALSALLAGIGLYGLVAYSVGQRSRELAMRLALGARPGAIYRLVGGEAARLAATGLLLGLGLYAGAHRLLGGLLFAVSGWDLPTLLAVVVLLGCVALVAGVLPARRAAAIHPAEALRAE
jgi:predicted permease